MLHKNTNLRLGKVNIFYGLNNTGKSSVIRALELLSNYKSPKINKETNTKEIKNKITEKEEYAEIEIDCITREREEIKVKARIEKEGVIKISQEDAVKKMQNLLRFSSFYETRADAFKTALYKYNHKIFELIEKLKSPELINDRNYNENYGKGSQQIITILRLLIIAKPGETICIEEPENGLHPRIQYRLAKLFVEIANEQKKQFIITTHSRSVIYGFLNSIASKKIKTGDVFIYHFKKCKDVKIKRKNINKYGQIKEGLDEMYDVVREETLDFLKQQTTK